ncbi:LysR family transcriptional regulator, partial [Staphylococcus hominis]
MDRLTAMQVFVEVAERGSLTAAAEALDMSRAMVTRYLAEMETWLGARPLHRTTRR